MRTFAGIASLPGRPLEQTLQSLRPQVDIIGVHLNGYPSVPSYVTELSDFVLLSPENKGSSVKLHWVRHFDGLYFACDDDLWYPPEYVEVMRDEFTRHAGSWLGKRWTHPLFVTACGRTLKPDATRWNDWMGEHRYIEAVPEARWINYLGGCAFAFDTRNIVVPEITPPNEEEAVLSAWAQCEGIPIRLVARPRDWPRRLALPSGAFTLYEAALRDRFRTRSAIIATVPQWRVHQPI